MKSAAWLELYARAFAWIVVGGAVTGVFALGSYSNVLAGLSAISGAWLGVLVGIPGAAVLAVVIGRWADPPGNPQRLMFALQTTGAVVALAVEIAVMGQIIVGLIDADELLNAVYALVGVGLSGRWAGRRFATGHLRAHGMTVPPSCFRLRRTAPAPPGQEAAPSQDPGLLQAPWAAGSGTPMPLALRRELALAAWLWILIGGMVTAPLALPPFSLLYFPAATGMGMVVGLVVGLPGAMGLTSWLTPRLVHTTDPEALVRTLQHVGSAGALAGCTLCCWWFVLITDPVPPEPAFLLAYAATVAAVAFAGRWTGRRLAVNWLRQLDLAVPRSRVARCIRPDAS